MAAADVRGAQRSAERQVCWDVGAEERWGRSQADGRPGGCTANQSENQKIIINKDVYPSERRWIFFYVNPIYFRKATWVGGTMHEYCNFRTGDSPNTV
jgi:hypothetical protein